MAFPPWGVAGFVFEPRNVLGSGRYIPSLLFVKTLLAEKQNKGILASENIFIFFFSRMKLSQVAATIGVFTLAIPWSTFALVFSSNSTTPPIVSSSDSTITALVGLGKKADAVDRALEKMQNQATEKIVTRIARRQHVAILSEKRAAVIAALKSLSQVQNQFSLSPSAWTLSLRDQAVTEVKTSIADFKQALTDARDAARDNDPFMIPTETSSLIQQEILVWQNDLATWLANVLQQALENQTADGTASLSFATDGIKVGVQFTSIHVDQAPKNSSQFTRLVGSFSLSGTGIELPENTTVRGTFDVAATIINSDAYFTIYDWNIENRSDFEQLIGPEHAVTLAALESAKGVTLKVPRGASSSFQPTRYLSEWLRVLRTIPAVKVARQDGARYLLADNEKFAQALLEAAGGSGSALSASKTNSSFLWFWKENNASIIEGTQDNVTLRVSRTNDGKYATSIVAKDGSFALSASGGVFHLQAGQSPFMGATVDWKNGQLDAKANMMGTTFAASGALNSSSANLKFAYLEKPAGTLQWNKMGGHETTNLQIAVAPQEANRASYRSATPGFHFSFISDITKASFNGAITAPQNAVDAEEFFKKVQTSWKGTPQSRDVARKAAAQNIIAGLETYYQDYEEYPTNPLDQKFQKYFKGGKIPTGPAYPGGTFCRSTFIYQPGNIRNNDEGWNTFSLATCMEDPKKAGADKDQGDRPTYLEIFGNGRPVQAGVEVELP